MNKVLLSIMLTCSSLGVIAQNYDTSIFSIPIQMDEVVISAARKGWDIKGFMNRVKNDTTFFKAFKSLRVTPHSINNDISILDKKGNNKATYKSITKQIVKNGCRSMTENNRVVTGNFFDRKGEYNYLTAELYAYLFFTEGKICGENDIVGTNEPEKGKLGKYKWQLKQMIFNPGSKIPGVPLIANKLAIFEPDVAKMYQFKLVSDNFDGQPCFIFKATPKPEYANEVVYNEVSTWFRKTDYSIVSRKISLSYKTIAFNFDVIFNVNLTQVNGKLLPHKIHYSGNWWALTQGKERAIFNAIFSY